MQGWECTVYSFASVHAAQSNALTSLYTQEGALRGYRTQNKKSFLKLKIGNDHADHNFNQNFRAAYLSGPLVCFSLLF